MCVSRNRYTVRRRKSFQMWEIEIFKNLLLSRLGRVLALTMSTSLILFVEARVIVVDVSLLQIVVGCNRLGLPYSRL